MYEQQFNWLDRLQEILVVDNKEFVFIIRKISIQNQGSTNINIARIANAVQVTICLLVSTSVY